jgi:hypothetical protein
MIGYQSGVEYFNINEDVGNAGIRLFKILVSMIWYGSTVVLLPRR